MTAEIVGAASPTSALVGSADVGPRADDDPGPLEQLGPVARRARRAAPAPARPGGRPAPPAEVDEHDQHPRPLDVAQELVPEAPALARPLDEPGDVGDHELVAVVEAHDAEVGLERGERVVGDLGLGRRDRARSACDLPTLGKPDERDVGHQLQLEPQPALLARLALLGERRRPPAVGEEPGVAPAAPAAGAPRASGRRRARGRRARSPSWSCTTVPSGTGTTRSSPPAPCLRLALAVGAARRPAGGDGRGRRAATPRCGRRRARRRRPCRRRRRRGRPWARGPRAGTTTQPAPPSPPRTLRLHSSTNPDTNRG